MREITKSGIKISSLLFSYEFVMSENQNDSILIPGEVVLTKIFVIRNKKVMIDRDLAELYGLETKRLKEAVRRNIARFPVDFMFQMSSDEFSLWRSQFATSNQDRRGLRHAPFCFTEQGVTMLSCVLNSNRAIQVNIQIIRIFARMREILSTHKDILQKFKQLEKLSLDHDEKIKLIFKYLKQLEEVKQEELESLNSRPKIGYRREQEE